MQTNAFLVLPRPGQQPVIEEKVLSVEQLEQDYSPLTLRANVHSAFIDIKLEDFSESIDQNKEMQTLARILKIDLEVFDDIIMDQRPRLDNYVDYLLLFFKSATEHPTDPLDKREYQIALIVMENIVIAIHRFEPYPLEKLFKRFRKYTITLFQERQTYLLTRYFEYLLDPTISMLTKWNRRSDEMEKALIRSHKKSDEILDDIVAMRYVLYDIIKIMQANREVINLLTKPKLPFIVADLVPPELDDHARHIIDEAELLRTFMSDLMNMFYSSESSQLNKTLARFTFATSLLLFPSLISGIFGMNNTGFPPIPFWWTVLFMVIGDLLLFIFFKKKGFV
jgi:magnesium transporter